MSHLPPEMKHCQLKIQTGRDTFYRDVLNFEKSLPNKLIQAKYKTLSIWSLVRIQIFNQLIRRVPSKAGAARGTQKVAQWIRKINSVCKAGFFAFAIGIIKGHGAQVIIRVNSFSILGESEGRVLFKNKNLQDILDHLLMNGVSCLVIVNDLSGYRLQQKLSNAIVYPALLPFFLRNLFYIFNRAVVNKIVNLFKESLPLEAPSLRNIILNHFAVILIWNVIYKYLKPKIIYYESPHNCFEAEVVAAKIKNIKTIEIYHGVITPNEPSYFQKHLNFDGLVHGVCDEYLSPSKKQTKFLAEHNDKYKIITTINYKSNFSLSIRNKLKILKLKNRPVIGKKKVLFVTALCDGAINDVSNYIKKNRLYLLKTFDKILIRLHPEDTEARWAGLIRKFPFIDFSNLPLIEDVISSNTLILINTTVALQLKNLKINFINISKEKVI